MYIWGRGYSSVIKSTGAGIACYCVTAVARKRTRSFCQKCRWQVTPKYAYTLDLTKSEWADYVTVQRCL